MKILWFTWKDLKNPYAGGAEVVNEQLAKRLAAEGHEVIFLVRTFQGSTHRETIDGYTVIRVGNYHTVYWEAYKYYKKHLRGWADLVIEEVNTIPFFTNFYVKEKSVLLFHQLCREIWFYEMGPVKGLIGYLLESVYLFFLGNREVITVSPSTKRDLSRFGFRPNKISIISEGIEIEPVSDIAAIEKFAKPTVLSLGAWRPMKRTDQIVQAFERAKQDIPDLELIIAGDTTGAYGKKVLRMIEQSAFRDAIHCLGHVSREKKIELMQKAHLLCAASVKEGWGLVVTEANSQGTPAVVFDIDGLRDSVKSGQTGFVCAKNTPEDMAAQIVRALGNKKTYARIREHAWQWSKQITFQQSHRDFTKLILAYVQGKKSPMLRRLREFFSFSRES